MNGRAYDYNLGRFLSVDPIIQAPGNSQSLNPYSYIMNNPLAGTDPTGYCSKELGSNICRKELSSVQVSATLAGNIMAKAAQAAVNDNGSQPSQPAVPVQQAQAADIEGQQSADKPVVSNNSNGENQTLAASAMSAGAGVLNAQGGLTISSTGAGTESGTGTAASDIAKTAGKWLVKIGKGGNIILMALTPTNIGDGTLDLTQLRSADEQKQDLWFHYTDEEGFNKIVQENYTIRANKKGLVYLTKFEMSPAKAVEHLFIGGWGDYANKGNYVIIFATNPGVQVQPVANHEFEWVHRGSMKLGSEIKSINYANENPF